MLTHVHAAQNLTSVAQGLPLLAYFLHIMRNDGARTLMFSKHPTAPNGAGKLASAAARVTQPAGSPTMPPDGVMQKNQSFLLRR